MRNLVLTFVILGCLCGSGFAEEVKQLEGMSNGAKAALLYLPNRLMDFVDIFRLNVGVGEGWGANLRATNFLTAGVSDYDTIRFGMRGREMPRYEEAVDEECIGLFGLQIGKFDRDPYELAFTGHVAYAGLEAGLDLDEIVDFLLGLACVDYREDDMGPRVW